VCVKAHHLLVRCGLCVVRVSAHLTTYLPLQPLGIDPMGLCALPDGTLLISCLRTHCVYHIHPTTRAVERVAGVLPPPVAEDRTPTTALRTVMQPLSTRLLQPYGLLPRAAEKVVYVCERAGQRVSRLALPHLFTTPSSSLFTRLLP
jgi:hypothetical protein